MYTGNHYRGMYLEGNQYLISSTKNEVLIIDMIIEEMGVKQEKTRINIPIEKFIFLIGNKKSAMECIREKMEGSTIFD